MKLIRRIGALVFGVIFLISLVCTLPVAALLILNHFLHRIQIKNLISWKDQHGKKLSATASGPSST